MTAEATASTKPSNMPANSPCASIPPGRPFHEACPLSTSRYRPSQEKWERRHEQAEQSPDSQQHRRASSKNLEDHAPSAPWYPRRAFVYKVGVDRSPRRRLRAGGRAAPRFRRNAPLSQNPKFPLPSPATLSRRSREARRRTATSYPPPCPVESCLSIPLRVATAHSTMLQSLRHHTAKTPTT